jgi:hypothetical protein
VAGPGRFLLGGLLGLALGYALALWLLPTASGPHRQKPGAGQEAAEAERAEQPVPQAPA